MNWYLASTSPRRKEVMDFLNIEYQIIDYDFEERNNIDDPYELARINAMGKAQHAQIDHGIIIAIDTFVICEEKILEKASNKQDARAMIEFLSGKKQTVLSGVCFYKPEEESLEYFEVTTTVQFLEINSQMVDWYVSTGEWQGRSGSYSIQDQGRLLIDFISGDVWNVVGFPTKAMRKIKSI
jgi:septum formation protein